MTRIKKSDSSRLIVTTLHLGLREPGPAAARPGEPGRGGGVPGARAGGGGADGQAGGGGAAAAPARHVI